MQRRRKQNSAFAALPQTVLLRATFHPSAEGAVRRAIHFPVAHIRQSGVVPRDADRDKGILPVTEQCPRRSVIHPRAAVQQPVLEALCAFSQIMRQTCQLAVGLRIKGCRKRPAQGCRSLQMLRHRLAAQAVLGDMGIVRHVIPPSKKQKSALYFDRADCLGAEEQP